jgi:methylthioribose-1-phosphate isomerase
MIDHIYWKNGNLTVLDQRLLPFKKVYKRCETLEDVVAAIKDMTIRGAPLIGIVAAYGVAIGIREAIKAKGRVRNRDVERMYSKLANSRPTAVNLIWALERMWNTYSQYKDSPNLIDLLLETAKTIHREDIENNRKLSNYGAELIDDGDTVLTHCNAGALATGGYGTALGVLRAAHESGKQIRVIATETRPYLQGARLTAWELHQEGIDVAIVPDNHAGLLCAEGVINKVIVGADRIARNGDVANKIGTYTIALAAHEHHIPFYVAAPLSSFDQAIKSGYDIEIEQRNGAEVTHLNGMPLTLKSIEALYYAFDITPGRLITYIVTERGVIDKPFAKYIRTLFPDKHEHYNGPH